MGWYYSNGSTRKELISELTKQREQTNGEGVAIRATCLASCYRGGVFSGVLWAVWERAFHKDGQPVEPSQRWISCDLMRCDKGDWGYKPLDEHMHPYFYSCPLGYLAMVPLDVHGGNAEWRAFVQSYHLRQKEKREMRRLPVQ